MPSKRQEKKKNESENEEEEEEGENKGFHVDGDMAKFLEHLDQHTRDLFQNTKEKKYWMKICLLFITAWQLRNLLSPYWGK